MAPKASNKRKPASSSNPRMHSQNRKSARIPSAKEGDNPERPLSRVRDEGADQGTSAPLEWDLKFLGEAKENTLNRVDLRRDLINWVEKDEHVFNILEKFKKDELDDPDSYATFSKDLGTQDPSRWFQDMRSVCRLAHKSKDALDEENRQHRWAKVVKDFSDDQLNKLPGIAPSIDKKGYKLNTATGILYTAADELYNSLDGEKNWFAKKFGMITAPAHVASVNAYKAEEEKRRQEEKKALSAPSRSFTGGSKTPRKETPAKSARTFPGLAKGGPRPGSNFELKSGHPRGSSTPRNTLTENDQAIDHSAQQSQKGRRTKQRSPSEDSDTDSANDSDVGSALSAAVAEAEATRSSTGSKNASQKSQLADPHTTTEASLKDKSVQSDAGDVSLQDEKKRLKEQLDQEVAGF